MQAWLENALGAVILTAFSLGWVDWLWIFSVEDSKSYTWWALARHMAEAG